MVRWRIILRYDWPLHFILFFTNWLPDNVIFLRLRGFLSRPFFGSCGHSLNIGRDVYIDYGCVFMAIDKISVGDEVMLSPYCVW